MQPMGAWNATQHMVLQSQWPSGGCELKHQPSLLERFLCDCRFPSLLSFNPHAPTLRGGCSHFRAEDSEASGGGGVM